MTYLHIRGTLQENMVYTPRAGRESPRPDRREGNSEFQLVLLDAQDRVLVSVTPSVLASGCANAGEPRRFQVRGCVPLHPRAVTYELRQGSISLNRTDIPSKPPAVALTHGELAGDTLSLKWRKLGQEKLDYDIVAQMDSGRRITLARGLTELHYKIELNRIPAAGTGQLLVVANDGVRSSEIEGQRFALKDRGPILHILSPAMLEKVPFGRPVSVVGNCTDVSGGTRLPSEAVWFLDGKRFAEGGLIAVVDTPSPGRHELVLMCGPEESPVRTSVQFEVEDPDEHFREWTSMMEEAISRTGGDPLR